MDIILSEYEICELIKKHIEQTGKFCIPKPSNIEFQFENYFGTWKPIDIRAVVNVIIRKE